MAAPTGTAPHQPAPHRGPAGRDSPPGASFSAPAVDGCRLAGRAPSARAHSRTSSPEPAHARASAGRVGSASAGTASGRAAPAASDPRGRRTISCSAAPLPHMASPRARPKAHRPIPSIERREQLPSETYKSGFTQLVNFSRSVDTWTDDLDVEPIGAHIAVKAKGARTSGGGAPAADHALGHRGEGSGGVGPPSCGGTTVRPEGIEPSACGLKDRSRRAEWRGFERLDCLNMALRRHERLVWYPKRYPRLTRYPYGTYGGRIASSSNEKRARV
jgi:hypothetical protein